MIAQCTLLCKKNWWTLYLKNEKYDTCSDNFDYVDFVKFDNKCIDAVSFVFVLI